jgi:HAD superfamily hydrolase (TIGR01509 family)
VRALILDCDGVIADTERELHLPAFNQAFAEAGLGLRWSDDEYAELLRIAGGKERMAAALPESDRELVETLHGRKAEILEQNLAGHGIRPRPGIVRLIGAADAAGWKLAVASTSSERSVRAVLAHTMGPDLVGKLMVLAGDVVDAKKPDPAIYELAVARLGVRKSEVVAVEDSRNGLLAATGAGLLTVITVSTYTAGEDFSEAALVLSNLGDPGAPMTVIANRTAIIPTDHLALSDLERLELP